MVRNKALQVQKVEGQIDPEDERISSIFRSNIPLARKRTLHQFIQALLREHLTDAIWNQKGKDYEVILPAKNNGRIIIIVSKRYLLHHIDIKGDIVYVNLERSIIIDHPVQMLELLRLEGGDLQSLSFELENAVNNYALAVTGGALRKEKLLWDADTFSYLLWEKKRTPRFSPLVFSEQWVIEGHTIHPCSKTRIGLSVEESTCFSPEWGGRPRVIPLAIHKDFVTMTSMNQTTMTDILLKEFPEVKTHFIEKLSNKGMENYELIPVHPWQFENTIKQNFREELEQDHIIPLLGATIDTSSLLSFRSLAPDSRTAHHFKTAVDIQMTSAKRTVSPTSVSNGPIISSLLHDIQMKDTLIGNKLRFLGERAGGHYQSTVRENGPFLMKNLSALLRENPESDLAEDEIAVPAAFLISESPFSGKLFLIELVETYRHTFGLEKEEAVLNYIKMYASLLLPGLIRLITKYGISLEAHLQNAVPVFSNGLPTRFLLRDSGGIRMTKSKWSDRKEMKGIDNHTNLLTDNDEDLFTMFSHALLHNHLGEILLFLSRKLEVSEEKLWKPIKEIITSTLAGLKKDDQVDREVIDTFEKNIFSPYIPLKALVTMRLYDQFLTNEYTLVPNPLITEGGV